MGDEVSRKSKDKINTESNKWLEEIEKEEWDSLKYNWKWEFYIYFIYIRAKENSIMQ